MSLETDALDAVALAATNQTIAANALKDAINALSAGYASTKNTVDTELTNVNNTTDADKPISIAALAEFLKYVQTANLATINGQPLDTGLALLLERSRTSSAYMLYENRASLRNPLIPLPEAEDTMYLQYLGAFVFFETTDEPDDDETCFSATHPDTGQPYGQWILEVPNYEWWYANENHERLTLIEWREDIEVVMSDYTKWKADIDTRLTNNNI
jgi:hypothetical protein